MDSKIGTVHISDDVWEQAAIEQLRDDVRGYPGGAKGFVAAHRDRLGIGYDAYNANLNGGGRISYQTFSRTVSILGFTPEEYDKRISARIAAKQNRK